MKQSGGVLNAARSSSPYAGLVDAAETAASPNIKQQATNLNSNQSNSSSSSSSPSPISSATSINNSVVNRTSSQTVQGSAAAMSPPILVSNGGLGETGVPTNAAPSIDNTQQKFSQMNLSQLQQLQRQQSLQLKSDNSAQPVSVNGVGAGAPGLVVDLEKEKLKQDLIKQTEMSNKLETLCLQYRQVGFD